MTLLDCPACPDIEEVVKQAFWLAWKAAEPPAGLGRLRDRPGATRDEVWQNARTAGDYPGLARFTKPGEPDDAYGDDVFGRRLKLHLKWTTEGVLVPDGEPDVECQTWSRTYPTYAALVAAAARECEEVT